MKNLLLIAVSFLMSISFLQSQSKLSLEFGINSSSSKFSDITNLDQASVENRTGFFIGVLPKIALTPRLAIIPNIQYSKEGYNRDNGLSQTRYSYIRINPLVEQRVLESIHLYTGLSIAMKVSEARKLNGSDWNDDKNIDLVKGSDFGVPFGAKLYFGDFHASISYYFGLSEVSEVVLTDQNGDPLGVESQKNRNLQIGIGYSFL